MLESRRNTSSGSPGSGRRYGGLYLAKVIRHDDPLQINRIKVKVFGIGGENILAWARVSGVLGGIATGCAFVPEPESHVLVQFEAELIDRPVVMCSVWFSEGAQSQIPLAARGEADPVRSARGVDSAVGAAGVPLTEPPDPFAAVYPSNRAYKSPAGHLIEFDDTAGVERISITHGTSQSWLEIHPDGSIVVGAKGNRYVLVEQNDSLHVKGRKDTVVDGECTHKTTGMFRSSCGDYQGFITGNTQIQAMGVLMAQFLSMVVTTTQDMSLICKGTLAMGPLSAPTPVMTLGLNPVDYITGIPHFGVPTVLAG